MPTMPKLILTAALKGLPFLIIIVSSGVYSARRKSIAGGMIALGCLAIAVHSTWMTFAPIWLRTHTPEEYGRIILPMSIASFAGWYMISIAIAAILIHKARTSDNN